MSILIHTELPASSPEWCDIFNSTAYFELYKTERSFYFSFSDENTVIGCVHCTETEPGVYKSPYRGTYGSFDFIEDIALEAIEDCIIKTCNYMHGTLNAKKIIIISPPFAHNLQKSSYIFNTLLNLGFEIVTHDIDYSIAVDDISIVDKMKRNNKKRYNKCLKEGFKFDKISDKNEYADVYNVIKANRDSKGYHLSMTFEQIMDLYTSLPDNVHFFKVKKDNQLAAAALCIKLNSDILYVFYWGHLPGFEQYSPVAFLANGIYEYAKTNEFNRIDIGTSSLNGQPIYGTITFKENLGFTSSIKLTYAKSYE